MTPTRDFHRDPGSHALVSKDMRMAAVLRQKAADAKTIDALSKRIHIVETKLDKFISLLQNEKRQDTLRLVGSFDPKQASER